MLNPCGTAPCPRRRTVPPLGSRGICLPPAPRGTAIAASSTTPNGTTATSSWSRSSRTPTPSTTSTRSAHWTKSTCWPLVPGDLAYAIGDGNNMTDSPKIRDAYLKVQAAADRHGVAVMGGPVLDPSVDGCKSALKDGVKVLPRPGCHGIPAVLRAHRAYRRRLGQGTAYTRPKTPTPDFAPHVTG